MSFSMWARPVPKDRPEPESFYALKWAFVERGRGLFDGDGSLRSGPVVITEDGLGDWLRGVRDGGGDASEEATRLLRLLEANPQGVEIWIGDSDDA